MTDLTIIASPGEAIRDHDGALIATVARSIYVGQVMDADDFAWPDRKPDNGERVHSAIDAFIAKKLRLAA